MVETGWNLSSLPNELCILFISKSHLSLLMACRYAISCDLCGIIPITMTATSEVPFFKA